ncbi:histidine kinase dimerization/phospho-acceptor domain-containing protein [Chitinophaga pinensis]
MGRMIIRQMRINSFKDDFINNITHELRTPLTILKSSIDALRALVFQQILRNLTDI